MAIDLKIAADTVALSGELIKAAGDSPEAKEAARNLGKTALTVTKTINNALLPLAAVNFAFDKARIYFDEKFQKDITEKAASIPFDNLIEPKASVAGPALQGLAFSHDESNLKEMYLSLLTTAMDKRIATEAHPAFVEIIKQITSEEAELISDIFKSHTSHPIVELRLSSTSDRGWHVIKTHVMNDRDLASNSPIENPRLSAMVHNLIRLGLLNVDYSKFLTGENSYSWVEERPEMLRLRNKHDNETTKIIFERGTLAMTDLGVQFAKAVGL